MGFSGAVVLGFCIWQLWSIRREIRKDRISQDGQSADDAGEGCGIPPEADESRRCGPP